ncbi:hypothetical protein C8J57DRAFT_1726765 [Mycena rebaudengoi]|nr:hypothetical protein C8J57DRAFT_1726765 [Mycena rebaudengoi]
MLSWGDYRAQGVASVRSGHRPAVCFYGVSGAAIDDLRNASRLGNAPGYSREDPRPARQARRPASLVQEGRKPNESLPTLPTEPNFSPMVQLLGQHDMRNPGSTGGSERLDNGAISFPYHVDSEGERAFKKLAWDNGWMLETDQDIMAWQSSPRGQQLFAITALDATKHELQLIITWLLRGERFCEGLVASHMESGLVEGILCRMQVLQNLDRLARLTDVTGTVL